MCKTDYRLIGNADSSERSNMEYNLKQALNGKLIKISEERDRTSAFEVDSNGISGGQDSKTTVYLRFDNGYMVQIKGEILDCWSGQKSEVPTLNVAETEKDSRRDCDCTTDEAVCCK